MKTSLIDISIYFWISFFIASIMGALLLFIKGKEKASPRYLQGIGIFLIVFFICRILYFISDFIWEDQFYWDLASLLGLISVTMFVFVVEKFVYTRSKYIFSAFGGFAIVWNSLFFILQNMDYIYLAQAVFLPAIAAIVPLIYLYVAIKSSGEARTKSFIILLGILIFMTGNVLHFELFKAGFAIGYYVLSPSLLIVGLALFIYGMLK